MSEQQGVIYGWALPSPKLRWATYSYFGDTYWAADATENRSATAILKRPLPKFQIGSSLIGGLKLLWKLQGWENTSWAGGIEYEPFYYTQVEGPASSTSRKLVLRKLKRLAQDRLELWWQDQWPQASTEGWDTWGDGTWEVAWGQKSPGGKPTDFVRIHPGEQQYWVEHRAEVWPPGSYTPEVFTREYRTVSLNGAINLGNRIRAGETINQLLT